MLQVVGRHDADAITLADLDERIERLGELGFNGDGVVPDTAAGDDATRRLIEQVTDAVGGVLDRNGKIGVDAAHARIFFEQADALHAWRERGAADPAVAPLGDASRAAGEALAAVQAKVDDYFLRCRLAAYDAAAAPQLHAAADDYRALGAQLLDRQAATLVELPVATPGDDAPLPLRERLNPAWAERIDRLRVRVAEPLLDRSLDMLHEAEWRSLKQRFAACGRWLADRPTTKL